MALMQENKKKQELDHQ